MGALADALTTTLEHVEDAYVDAGILDAPERQYVSPGPAPADCELVAVWGNPQAKETTSNPPQGCAIFPEALVTIRSWLCIPTGHPPDGDDLATAGARIHDHLWAVWSHLSSLISGGTYTPGAKCSAARLITTSLLEEEGAFAGWEIQLALDLDPYRTPAAS
jgi:hypothetical protein